MAKRIKRYDNHKHCWIVYDNPSKWLAFKCIVRLLVDPQSTYDIEIEG